MNTFHGKRLAQLASQETTSGFVAKAMGLLWVSKSGLAEADLVSVLSSLEWEGGRISAAQAGQQWNGFGDALLGLVSTSETVLTLADEAVREAVREQFLPDQDAQDDVRLELADFLETAPITPANTEEFFWQLQQSESCARLKAALLQIPRFSALFGKNPQVVWDLWNWLGDDGNTGTTYVTAFFDWASRDPDSALLPKAANELSFFLHRVEMRDQAEQLLSRAVPIIEQRLGSDHPDLASTLNNLAVMYLSTGRLAQAEPVAKRVAQILIQFSAEAKKAHPYMGPALNNYAAVLSGMGLQPTAVMKEMNALLAPFGAQVTLEQAPTTGDSKPPQ